MVTPATEQVSLADAKARLSEVVEGIETEHRRVVITKHGRPSVVVLAVADLEALADTLELLSDADAMADLREASAVDARIRTENFGTGCAGYLRIADPAWEVRLE
jgi:antitoxin YefM